MEEQINFPENTIKLVEEDVQKLVQKLTGYEQHENDDYKRCVDFTMYHILCEKHSIPSQSKIREKLDSFVSKYDYEGFSNYSEGLKNDIAGYINSHYEKNIDEIVNWRVLEALLLLSCDAFKTETLMCLEGKLKACSTLTLPNEFTEEEKINWYEYLQEGCEKYRLPSDDSESSSYDSDSFETKLYEDHDCPPVSTYNDIFGHFPQPNVLVDNEDVILKKTMADGASSKVWFLNNLQHSWWNNKHNSIPDSRYPAATFGLQWQQLRNDTCVHDEPMSVQFLDEYKIIRELLWIFNAEDKHVYKRIEFLKSQVSAPSLIQETTKSFIENILDTAKKYCILSSYCDRVLSNNMLQITFSQQAYASVLKDLCRQFLMRVNEEEKSIREQDTTYTLLTLHSNLKSYLSDINFIYEVHASCVLLDCVEESSWVYTVRLLSEIFYKLKATELQAYRKILLKIFFKTFRVYANMIDVWLTEGKLYDWKGEFFIKKDHTKNIYEAFPMDAVDNQNELTIAPFFHRICASLLNCSQNVEFLCKLNKLQSRAEEILMDGKLIDSLKDEFMKLLYLEEMRNENTCVIDESNVDEYGPAQRGEFEKNNLGDVYLFQAYSDVFKLIKNCGELNLRVKSSTNENEWIEKLENLDVFPVANTLERALCSLIERRELVIAKFFKMSIVDDYKFFDHIKSLSGLLLMDLHSLCNRINIGLEKQIWESSHMMKMFLYDCVESNKLPFGSLFHFTTDKENMLRRNPDVRICISQIIKMIDHISLQYAARWPISMIFTDSIIKNFYDPLFKLILKINIAFFSITRLCFKDLPETRLWRWKLRRMEMFRHWVILLLQKLRSYLTLIVPQCLDWKLIENVIEINTFNSLETNYSDYLENVKHKCLIDPKSLECLNRALDRVWSVCDDVRDLWLKGKRLQLTGEDVSCSVELYIQCLWYLAQILKKLVEGKRNNNPLYNLWMDLQNIVEIHEENIPEDLSFKSCQQTFV